MGLICELYRVDDATIDKIVKNPVWGFEFIIYNYAETRGPFHKENDTVFSMDKAWAIADYLISQFARSKGREINVLGEKVERAYTGSDGIRVIKSEVVKGQNEIIRQIDTATIGRFYNREDTLKHYHYRADGIEEIDNYVISHVAKIQQAYSKAASENHGLVIRIG